MGRIKKEKDYISNDDYSSFLCRIYRIAYSLDIPVWLTFGTLLGFAQQGKRFEWDNDIDLATTTEGFDELIKHTELFRQYGLEICPKKQKPRCFRELFIYDKNIQPFHVDLSEFAVDNNGRFTYRWLIRVNLPAKVFDFLYTKLLAAIAKTNHTKEIPFYDSKKYIQYKENKLIKTISNILYKIDMFFTTTRELGMNIDAFAVVKYYHARVLIPIPLDKYCAVNYGKNWTTPIKVRKTLGGSDCIKEIVDGIEKCYLPHVPSKVGKSRRRNHD